MHISKKEARRLFLSRQGLLRKDQFGRGRNAVKRAIDQLSWLQIDTISVVERAHHHILRTRVSNYESIMLHRLQAKDRQFFEYRCVQFLSGFARRLAIFNDRLAEFVKLLSPPIARFVDVGVGQNVVEENVIRNLPAGVGSCTIRQSNVGQQKFSGQVF